MTVKRYEAESDPQDGPCSIWMEESPEGHYVTHSDYQKLVAENAALNGAIERVSGVYKLSPHIQKLCEIKTPNTDAAIAEIKASELDDLAKSIMEYAPVIEADEYYAYESIAKDVTDRASNLRAGRKG